MMLYFVLACDDVGALGTVALSGVVEDAPFHGGAPFAGATLETRNREGAVVDTAVSDADGAFSVAVDSGTSFFLQVSADERLTTSFSGVAGVSDFVAETGLPWIADPAWLAETTAEYDACPQLADAGGTVIGDVRVNIGAGAADGWPPFAGVEVAVLASDGATYAACYFNDDGASEASLTQTGAGGEFVVFGVPDGAINVTFTALRSNGEVGTDVYEYIVADAGVVPIYPAALEI